MVLPWLPFTNMLHRSSSVPAYGKHCTTIAMMNRMNAPCSGGLPFLDCCCSGLAWLTEFPVSFKTGEDVLLALFSTRLGSSPLPVAIVRSIISWKVLEA